MLAACVGCNSRTILQRLSSFWAPRRRTPQHNAPPRTFRQADNLPLSLDSKSIASPLTVITKRHPTAPDAFQRIGASICADREVSSGVLSAEDVIPKGISVTLLIRLVETVDQSAVIDALRSGQLACRRLDVFASEPVVDDPLLRLDNAAVLCQTSPVYAHIIRLPERSGVRFRQDDIRLAQD